jgi:hypothetical protein
MQYLKKTPTTTKTIKSQLRTDAGRMFINHNLQQPSTWSEGENWEAIRRIVIVGGGRLRQAWALLRSLGNGGGGNGGSGGKL